LLAQSDKCHALAIRIWTESPYLPTEETDKNTARMTTEQWWAQYYQLEWEISKAESLTETLKSEANKALDEAESRLSAPTSSVNKRYVSEFQRVRATYMDKLEQISLYLEQARKASGKLRCQVLSSPPGD
jgi:phage shock protein A